MSDETSKTPKSATAIIRDVGFIVAALGAAFAVVGLITKAPGLFQGGFVVALIGAAIGVVAGILWTAGLRR